MEHDEYTTLTIRLPKSVHKELKTSVVIDGERSINKVVEQLIRKYLTARKEKQELKEKKLR